MKPLLTPSQKAWSAFGALLVINFIALPLFVETIFYDWLLVQGIPPLYAGNIVGLLLAISLIGADYLLIGRQAPNPHLALGINRFPVRWTGWLMMIGFFTFLLGAFGFLLAVFWDAPMTNDKIAALYEIDLLTITIAFLGGCIISPLYEEIHYRGAIYGFIRSRVGVAHAQWISTMLFTLAHLPNWNLIFLTIIHGIVLAIVYEKTNSVFASVIVHATSNFFYLLISIFGLV